MKLLEEYKYYLLAFFILLIISVIVLIFVPRSNFGVIGTTLTLDLPAGTTSTTQTIYTQDDTRIGSATFLLNPSTTYPANINITGYSINNTAIVNATTGNAELNGDATVTYTVSGSATPLTSTINIIPINRYTPTSNQVCITTADTSKRGITAATMASSMCAALGFGGFGDTDTSCPGAGNSGTGTFYFCTNTLNLNWDPFPTAGTTIDYKAYDPAGKEFTSVTLSGISATATGSYPSKKYVVGGYVIITFNPPGSGRPVNYYFTDSAGRLPPNKRASTTTLLSQGVSLNLNTLLTVPVTIAVTTGVPIKIGN